MKFAKIRKNFELHEYSNLGGIEMNKTLVAFFSASGTTRKVAERLAQASEADFYEIKPDIQYTKADLDWKNKKSRSSIEMSDKSIRPKLAERDAKITQYDWIFLGFPIWWYVAPKIINTFLESYDFSDKKIILFATSGGSGFGNVVNELKSSVASSTIIKEGKILNGSYSVSELKVWVNSIK